MQFQVPQFIDVEDKIFGPFSFKQFLYLLGGGGGAFVIWKLLPWYLAIPLIIPVVSLAGALTFMKVNNRPFAFALQAWIGYIFTNKLYLWQQRKPEIKKQEEKKSEPTLDDFNYVPRLSGSKLKDMAWSLDVLDSQRKK